MKKIALVFIYLLVMHLYLKAQEKNRDTLKTDDFYIDFATPEITAFSILDIEPNSISKPGNIKEFALGITNYVNQNGALRAGLAVEWAPIKTFDKSTENWENGSNHQLKFEWKNLTVSLATTSDSTNVKFAGAFKFAPIDMTNPLNNKKWVDSISDYFNSVIDQRIIQGEELNDAKIEFRKRVNKIFIDMGVSMDMLEKLSKPLDVANSYYMNGLKSEIDSAGILYDRQMITNKVFDEINELFIANDLSSVFNQNETDINELCEYFADLFYQHYSRTSFQSDFNEHILKMKDDFKKKNWNKLACQVSFGGLVNSEEATLNDFKNDYYSYFLSAGFPLIGKKCLRGTSFHTFMRNHSQLIMQIKSQHYFTQDSSENNYFFAGARILLGNYDKRFSLEIAYIHESNELTNLLQSGIRYSIGTEIKIMDNYWLELAIGGQNFEDKTGVNILPTFAFRHSFGNENRFFK
jgi:hypothetical protein